MSIHVCTSTQNQTVNLLPALSLKAEKVYIVSSEVAEKGHWTELLKLVLKRKRIPVEIIYYDEQKPEELSKQVDEKLSDYKQIYWNISGGKKSQTMVVIRQVFRRFKTHEDYVIYLENNPFELCTYKGFNLISRKKMSVSLELEDILNLYGFTSINSGQPMPEELSVEPESVYDIRKINDYFMNNEKFTEFLLKYMQPRGVQYEDKSNLEKDIKNIINHYQPLQQEVLRDIKKPTVQAFQNLIQVVRSIVDTKYPGKTKWESYQKRLSRITNVEFLYNDYWNQVKKGLIETLAEHIREGTPSFYLNYVSNDEKQRVTEMIKDCKGSYDDDNIEKANCFKIKHGFLFELMVQTTISSYINQSKGKTSIVKAYKNIETYPIMFDDEAKPIYPGTYSLNQNDKEIDILLITEYGTFEIIECKTFGFQGETLRSQRDTAYTKSGPFGKVSFAIPLLSNMKNEEGLYPEYVPAYLKDALATFSKHSVNFYFFDCLVEDLKTRYGG